MLRYISTGHNRENCHMHQMSVIPGVVYCFTVVIFCVVACTARYVTKMLSGVKLVQFGCRVYHIHTPALAEQTPLHYFIN